MHASNDILEAKRFFDELKAKTVVILGCYDGEHKTFLDNLATILQVKKGYVPLMLEDLYKISSGTPRQAIHNMISACNFVIADDTMPSGESLELEYCRNCGAITAIICRLYEERWKRSTLMTCDFPIHSLDFFVRRFNYDVSDMVEIEKLVNYIINRKDNRQKEILQIMKKRVREYNKYAKKPLDV